MWVLYDKVYKFSSGVFSHPNQTQSKYNLSVVNSDWFN